MNNGRSVALGSAVAGMLAFAGPAFADPPAGSELSSVRTSIVGSMQDSAVAWSKGDLDGFMSGYEDQPTTTYVTGGKVVVGYDAIRSMYRARFGGHGEMGTLSLTMSDVRLLGADYALGLGRYSLLRSGRPTPLSGVYTLVFHRTAAGWKIISDHTSS